MTVYLPAGKDTYKVKIPSPGNAEPVVRTTGTTNGRVAKAIDAMITHLGPSGARAWDILDRVALGDITVSRLYDAYTLANRDVEQTRIRLNEVDLASLMPAYEDHCKSSLRNIAADTLQRYVLSAKDFVGTSLLPRDCTVRYCRTWLAKIAVDRSSGTVRKWAQGAKDFCDYARDQGALTMNPWFGLSLPAPSSPRITYLDDPERDVYLDALPEGLYRSLAILALGTSADLSPVLQVAGRDFDRTRQAVRVPGTKAHNRDRICLIDRWAWKRLAPMITALRPEEQPFKTLDRWRVRDVHAAACARLVADHHRWAANYWFRDHRHTWAVRAVRAGMPLELVARQLGHVNALLVLRVYGRFIPTTAEMDSWRDRIEAAARKRHPPSGKAG